MSVINSTIDEDICGSESDIHYKMDKAKVDKVIDDLKINRFSFFKTQKKMTKDDIENFNLVLETCYNQVLMNMSDAFLVLCAEFIDIPKAIKILTQHNLSVIKDELMYKYNRKDTVTRNSLLTFF